ADIVAVKAAPGADVKLAHRRRPKDQAALGLEQRGIVRAVVRSRIAAILIILAQSEHGSKPVIPTRRRLNVCRVAGEAYLIVLAEVQGIVGGRYRLGILGRDPRYLEKIVPYLHAGEQIVFQAEQFRRVFIMHLGADGRTIFLLLFLVAIRR